MLFYPRRPHRFGPITIQGVFPRRQAVLAEKLGTIIEDQLLSPSDLATQIRGKIAGDDIHTFLTAHINELLCRRIGQHFPILPSILKEMLVRKIQTILIADINAFLPELEKQFLNGLIREVDIPSLVKAKVLAFSSDRLEELLLALMRREFRFIEISGGVLGFLIGLLQVALSSLSAAN